MIGLAALQVIGGFRGCWGWGRQGGAVPAWQHIAYPAMRRFGGKMMPALESYAPLWTAAAVLHITGT